MRPLLTGPLAVALALAALAPAASAATFTVNEVSDHADADVADAVCDHDLAAAGAQCTLRAAIDQANDTTAHDTIEFAISPTGTAQTIAPDDDLPLILTPVTIDGWSQLSSPAAGPGIDLDGSFSGSGAGLFLGSATGTTTVRGLAIGNFALAGIVTDGADSVIEGNRIGTDLAGLVARPNEAGVVVLAGNARVGGAGSAQNLLSGNDLEGVLVSGPNTRVTGNRIGLGADLEPLPNETGVVVWMSSGPTTIDGNVIAGNLQDGIELAETSSHTVVHGNWIGTTPGHTIHNGWNGISIAGSDNTIGGVASGEPNRIRSAGNAGSGGPFDGVRISGTAARRNRVRGNVILYYPGLSLALLDGANGGQPAPQLTTAVRGRGSIWVAGTASGPAGTVVTVDVYSSSSHCAPSNADEYLGAISAPIHAGGRGAFSALVPTEASLNAISATVTTTEGNTSRFDCIEAPLSSETIGGPFAPAQVREGAGTATIVLNRFRTFTPADPPPLGPASAAYSIRPMTAGAEDFEAVSGRVVFAPGETQKSISVRIVDDREREKIETLGVALSDPRGTARTTFSSGTISIQANDRPPEALITAPRRNGRARALRAFSGTVSDQDDDALRVDIALLRVLRGRRGVARCQRLTRSGQLAPLPPRAGACRPLKFIRAATARGRWVHRLRKRLPAGRYLLYARGLDAEHHADSHLTARDRNRVEFRLR